MRYEEAKQLILGSRYHYSKIEADKFSVILGGPQVLIRYPSDGITYNKSVAERFTIRFTPYKDIILAVKRDNLWKSSIVKNISMLDMPEWERITCLETLDDSNHVSDIRSMVRDTEYDSLEWELCNVKK